MLIKIIFNILRRKMIIMNANNIDKDVVNTIVEKILTFEKEISNSNELTLTQTIKKIREIIEKEVKVD